MTSQGSYVIAIYTVRHCIEVKKALCSRLTKAETIGFQIPFDHGKGEQNRINRSFDLLVTKEKKTIF